MNCTGEKSSLLLAKPAQPLIVGTTIEEGTCKIIVHFEAYWYGSNAYNPHPGTTSGVYIVSYTLGAQDLNTAHTQSYVSQRDRASYLQLFTSLRLTRCIRNATDAQKSGTETPHAIECRIQSNDESYRTGRNVLKSVSLNRLF